VYSRNDLEMENEDGISIIYYLQKIFPGADTALVTFKCYFFVLLASGLLLLTIQYDYCVR